MPPNTPERSKATVAGSGTAAPSICPVASAVNACKPFAVTSKKLPALEVMLVKEILKAAGELETTESKLPEVKLATVVLKKLPVEEELLPTIAPSLRTPDNNNTFDAL